MLWKKVCTSSIISKLRTMLKCTSYTMSHCEEERPVGLHSSESARIKTSYPWRTFRRSIGIYPIATSEETNYLNQWHCLVLREGRLSKSPSLINLVLDKMWIWLSARQKLILGNLSIPKVVSLLHNCTSSLSCPTRWMRISWDASTSISMMGFGIPHHLLYLPTVEVLAYR